tara:strand:- start:12192 stop:12533 length:342 start_codon:yes stop_codon:yes gene_type:complete
MTKINAVVGIQFIKGKNEKVQPEIRLFRSSDGKKGAVIYKFFRPKTITLKNLNSIEKMYLIDEEGEISTRKIDLSILNNNITEVKSTYNWNSEKEFERFMRFAKRYANSFTNH